METKIEGDIEKNHSIWSILSFVSPTFGLRSVINIMAIRFTFFYETEIFLPIGLMTLAIIFYTIWDMFNDPLFGHLTDRNYRFTRRWGRRYPWIISSSIVLVPAFILFFMPPDPRINVWATFFWFLFLLMLFDGLSSLAAVTYNALLPNKYKSTEERTKISAFRELISTIGLMLGFIIPPLIIVYGDPTSYITMAIVCGIMLLISVILGIPGMREGKDLIDSYYLQEVKQEKFFKSFLGMIKTSLSQKNFRALIYINFVIAVYDLLFVASIPYYIKYIVKGDASLELMLYIPYLLVIVLPIPFYYWLSKKFGHLKVVIFSGFALSTILMILLFFNTNLIIVVILVSLMGMSNGMGNVAIIPLYGDFFDESAVFNKKRQEGVYYGILTFFSRSVYIFQLLAFWLIHDLTGFNPDAAEQTLLAQFGILLHFLLLPAIVMYIGYILFTKTYDLRPVKVKQIKEQLKELNL